MGLLALPQDALGRAPANVDDEPALCGQGQQV